MGFVVGILVVTVGAILRYATDFHSSTWNVRTIGDILMIVGVVGCVLAAAAWAYWDGFAGRRARTVYRQASSLPPVHGPDGYARTTYATRGAALEPGLLDDEIQTVESEQVEHSSML
jgi:hypothetical protein